MFFYQLKILLFKLQKSVKNLYISLIPISLFLLSLIHKNTMILYSYNDCCRWIDRKSARFYNGCTAWIFFIQKSVVNPGPENLWFCVFFFQNTFDSSISSYKLLTSFGLYWNAPQFKLNRHDKFDIFQIISNFDKTHKKYLFFRYLLISSLFIPIWLSSNKETKIFQRFSSSGRNLNGFTGWKNDCIFIAIQMTQSSNVKRFRVSRNIMKGQKIDRDSTSIT